MTFASSENRVAELRDRGIVIIDNYLSSEQCDSIRQEIDKMLDRDSTAWETGSVGMQELVGRNEVVVNERSGDNDDGMLDIFNVDAEIDAVEEVKTDPGINELINQASEETFSPQTMNVYYNQEVTDTRDFHADTYGGKYKAFVYLTDVPNKDYGPFSYIPETHKASTVKRKSTSLVNKLKGTSSTDAVFYDEDDAIYCTAPKGTLIVANQAGYHRGTPQKKGHTRVLLNTQYTPD